MFSLVSRFSFSVSFIGFGGFSPGSHSRFPFKILIQGSHLRFPLQVSIQSSHSRFPLKVLIQGSHSRFPFKVPTQGSHLRFPFKVPILGSHSKFPLKVPIQGFHSRFPLQIFFEVLLQQIPRSTELASEEGGNCNNVIFGAESSQSRSHVTTTNHDFTSTGLTSITALGSSSSTLQSRRYVYLRKDIPLDAYRV